MQNLSRSIIFLGNPFVDLTIQLTPHAFNGVHGLDIELG